MDSLGISRYHPKEALGQIEQHVVPWECFVKGFCYFYKMVVVHLAFDHHSVNAFLDVSCWFNHVHVSCYLVEGPCIL